MNGPSNSDPRIDQAVVTDDAVVVAHEKLLGKQPDEKARYRLLPLNLLFIFSGLIFFGATYLGRYAGYFDPKVFDETAPKATAAAAAPEDPIEKGKKVYATVCAACHQANGMGLPGAFPPLVESEWVVGSEERLIRIALHGLQGPVKVKGADFNSMMPAAGRVAGSGFNLSDDRIAAVLTYVRQEWGNKAGPITTEKVAEIHGKEGDHKPWTAAELEKLP
ncbi:MAG: cytochrome c [Opitutaceae bacterium]|nr:cytochrome c [Opitutaceae bacterium]